VLTHINKTTGPIPLSAFMRLCLTHPDFGYYTTRDPLGPKGDFITSPEISQMFGEMIGIWLFTVWHSQKKPQHINLIEFGPGKGTLMLDTVKSFSKLLKTLKNHEELKLNIIMIETSEVLKKAQWALLSDSKLDTSKDFWEADHKWNGKITWVSTEKDVWEISNEVDSNYILAHEFFDALPINQFKKTKNGWREYLVDQHPETHTFHLTVSPHERLSSKVPETNSRYSVLPVGSDVEISSDLYSYTKQITHLIDKSNNKTGAALIVDYGPSFDVPENTLRGIKNHKITNPFRDPGEVDLSADVDFQAIAQVATADQDVPIDVFGPVEQGDWLHQLGIQYRAEQLYNQAKTDSERDIIKTGYHRLVEKDGGSMGHVYKFMALLPKGGPPPVGFGGGVEG